MAALPPTVGASSPATVQVTSPSTSPSSLLQTTTPGITAGPLSTTAPAAQNILLTSVSSSFHSPASSSSPHMTPVHTSVSSSDITTQSVLTSPLSTVTSRQAVVTSRQAVVTSPSTNIVSPSKTTPLDTSTSGVKTSVDITLGNKLVRSSDHTSTKNLGARQITAARTSDASEAQSTEAPSGGGNTTAIAVGVTLGVVVLIGILVILIICYFRRWRPKSTFQEEERIEDYKIDNNKKSQKKKIKDVTTPKPQPPAVSYFTTEPETDPGELWVVNGKGNGENNLGLEGEHDGAGGNGGGGIRMDTRGMAESSLHTGLHPGDLLDIERPGDRRNDRDLSMFQSRISVGGVLLDGDEMQSAYDTNTATTFGKS